MLCIIYGRERTRRGKCPNSRDESLRDIIWADHMKAASQNHRDLSDYTLNAVNSSARHGLDRQEFAVLSAACARLIPQPDREQYLGIARAIDHRLAEEAAGRWPRAFQFLDGASVRLGLRGLNELSQARLRRDFGHLDPVRQDQILLSVKNGTATIGVWRKLSPKRFFEGLLQESTEIYHSIPSTDDAVNF
jgi:hypothetical protein